MTTTADVLAAARRHLEANHRPTLNQLSAPLDTTDPVTVTFTYPVTRLTAGDYLSVGLEVLYVWSVATDLTSCVAGRGFTGSTSQTHSAGDLVRINPRFTDWEIFAAVNDDLNDLTSLGLYQVGTIDKTWDNTLVGYDLAADMLDDTPLGIQWKLNSPIKYWPAIRDYRVETSAVAGDFPSGKALFVYERGTPGQPFRVTYKRPLTQLATLTDDVVAVTGLPGSATDLPSMGAALLLMAGRPIAQADVTRQGDPRRAEEVPIGGALQSSALLRARRDKRIETEVARLKGPHPTILPRPFA